MTNKKVNKPNRTGREDSKPKIEFDDLIGGENLVTVTYKIKERQRDYLREKAHQQRTSASDLVRKALELGGVI